MKTFGILFVAVLFAACSPKSDAPSTKTSDVSVAMPEAKKQSREEEFKERRSEDIALLSLKYKLAPNVVGGLAWGYYERHSALHRLLENPALFGTSAEPKYEVTTTVHDLSERFSISEEVVASIIIELRELDRTGQR